MNAFGCVARIVNPSPCQRWTAPLFVLTTKLNCIAWEQSTGIDQVNQAVVRVDQVNQATAAKAEELSATADGLASQASRLQGLFARFKVGGATAAARSEAPADPFASHAARKRAAPGAARRSATSAAPVVVRSA